MTLFNPATPTLRCVCHYSVNKQVNFLESRAKYTKEVYLKKYVIK